MQKSEQLAYALQFREAFLRGTSSDRMCAALSAPLWAALSVLGVGGELHQVEFEDIAHIFIKLPDGDILDPTADQLSGTGLPSVFLGPARSVYRHSELWAGGVEWLELMVAMRRLYPSFDAKDIGKAAGDILRAMPADCIEFSTD